MKITIKFEPRDLWVGVYWSNELCNGWRPVRFGKQGERRLYRWLELRIYICLVPCFPIILTRETCLKETWG